MNQFAQTLLHQAIEAIDAGATSQAMDLLRQAKVLAAADIHLSRLILTQMIRIAPACNCEAEAALWRRQLAQASANQVVPVSGPARKPAAATHPSRSYRLTAIALGLVAVIFVVAFTVQRLRSDAAAISSPATTQPAVPATTSTQAT